MNIFINEYKDVFYLILKLCDIDSLISLYRCHKSINLIINHKETILLLSNVWKIKLGCKRPEKEIYLKQNDLMENIYPSVIDFNTFLIQYTAKYFPKSSLLRPMELLHIALKNDDVTAYTNLINDIGTMHNCYHELILYYESNKIIGKIIEDSVHFLPPNCDEYIMEFIFIEKGSTEDILKLLPTLDEKLNDPNKYFNSPYYKLITKYDRDDILPYINDRRQEISLDGMSHKIIKYFIDNKLDSKETVYIESIYDGIELNYLGWQTLELIDDLLTQNDIRNLIKSALYMLDTDKLDWLLFRLKERYQAPYTTYIKTIRIILKKHNVIDGFLQY